MSWFLLSIMAAFTQEQKSLWRPGVNFFGQERHSLSVSKAGRMCLLNSDVFKWAFIGKIFHIKMLKTIPGGFCESCLSMCDFSIKICCLQTFISIDFRSTHKNIEQKFNPGYLVSYNVINSICGKVQNYSSFTRQCSCVTAALCGLSSCLYLGVGWLPQAQKILDDLTP